MILILAMLTFYYTDELMLQSGGWGNAKLFKNEKYHQFKTACTLFIMLTLLTLFLELTSPMHLQPATTRGTGSALHTCNAATFHSLLPPPCQLAIRVSMAIPLQFLTEATSMATATSSHLRLFKGPRFSFIFLSGISFTIRLVEERERPSTP